MQLTAITTANCRAGTTRTTINTNDPRPFTAPPYPRRPGNGGVHQVPSHLVVVPPSYGETWTHRIVELSPTHIATIPNSTINSETKLRKAAAARAAVALHTDNHTTDRRRGMLAGPDHVLRRQSLSRCCPSRVGIARQSHVVAHRGHAPSSQDEADAAGRATAAHRSRFS